MGEAETEELKEAVMHHLISELMISNRLKEIRIAQLEHELEKERADNDGTNSNRSGRHSI